MRQNLFPVQIEDVITRHPGILEAAAVAVPNERYGEVVGVWIVRRNESEGKRITKEDARKYVSEGMNPQVCKATPISGVKDSFVLLSDPPERAGVGVVRR